MAGQKRVGAATAAAADDIPVLPGHAPVTMPELPPRLVILTDEQFKAISEPTRSRILGVIQNEPATAKQLADRVHVPHGTVGRHLQALLEAGLAQIVAKRLMRGIVAKYYTRTARIFSYHMSPDVTGVRAPSVEIVTEAANQFAETVAEGGATCRIQSVSFPHARLSAERVRAYQERFDALREELPREPHDPQGEVYGCLIALFRSPDSLQGESHLSSPARQVDDAHGLGAERAGEIEREINQARGQEGQEGDAG
jgi:DNA-binding transcriptional ArsR family regulator